MGSSDLAQAKAIGNQNSIMFISGLLIVWGWWFYFLSRCCFGAANTYLNFISRFVLIPLGHQPLMAVKQVTCQPPPSQNDQSSLQHDQEPYADDQDTGEHIHKLHNSISDLRDRVQQLQQSCIPTPSRQDSVQRWFANAATYDDNLNSDSSCFTVLANMQEKVAHHTVSCAAAAAAMALCSHTGVSAESTAAAVGTAALLAQQLSNSDSSDGTQQSSQRNSSCCTVPPLTFEVSDELQRELDEAAPAEFLCPLSRVLMTDPVCTPSGFTYQRSYIEAYISKTGHDPARDSTLSTQQLYPNIVLRDQIATWLQKHGVET